MKRHATTNLLSYLHPMRQLLITGALLITQAAYSQEALTRLSPKEFSIPAAPVFDLMGVTPSQINRTSDIKDFKVDWSFKSWRLNPNLAIQSQPVWELMYHRKDLRKYQAASRFMRRLASTDVSIGTIQDENSDRRIGFAVKMNLLKQHDPLMAKPLYEEIGVQFGKEKQQLETQIQQLKMQLDTTADLLLKPGLRNQLQAAEEQLLTINTRRNAEIAERAKIFVAEHWNNTSLDAAFGRIYTFGTDSAGTLKSLRLNRSTGWGGWVNGSLGIGRKWLFSGLFRLTWYEEALDFLLRNKSTQEEVAQKAVAENNLYTMGINLRYGGSIYTFFLEFLYEKKGLKTPLQALTEAFQSPEGFDVIGSSVKWNVVHPNTFSFGGDWRISRSVVINYGMRCVFDDRWKLQSFTPIATISCMMR